MPSRRVTFVGSLSLGSSLSRSRVVALLVALAAALSCEPSARLSTERSALAIDSNPWLARRVLLFAHRGGALEAPENTLYAFKRAVALGADVLEMDILVTSDGELVVHHDLAVERTTNGSGFVHQKTLAELETLDAAYWFEPDQGAVTNGTNYVFRGVATGERRPPPGYTAADFRIPTLRRVLETFPNTMLNLEIKATAPQVIPYEAALAALLAEFGRDSNTIVASEHDTAIEQFKLAATARSLPVSTALSLAQAAGFFASSQAGSGAPNPRYEAVQVPPTYNGIEVVDADFVVDAHQNGLAVHVWDAGDRDSEAALLSLGVDGIMTDRPSDLQLLLCERQLAFDGKRCTPQKLHTFVVVLDGLHPSHVNEHDMPRLFALASSVAGPASVYRRASASMIAETNANHVAMMTGLTGGAHGIVANRHYARGSRIEPLERPPLILAQTLFDAFRLQRPELSTAAVLGKEKLRQLFDCTRVCDDVKTCACGPSSSNPEQVAVTHVRPNFLEGATTNPALLLSDPDHNAPGEPVSGSGITLDNFIIDEVIRLQQTEAPDFTFVNLGTIDGVQHVAGPDSPEARAAIHNADLAIGRLVDYLTSVDRWQRSILIVTADHSFQSLDAAGDSTDVGDTSVSNPVVGQITGSRVILTEVLQDASIAEWVAHGGSASIYLTTPDDAEAAARVAAAARKLADTAGRPAVAAAYCRLPSITCPGIPATWGLSTARIGEVLLVADDQHVFLRTRVEASAALTGHHGGPTSVEVPLVVTSGGPFVARRVVDDPVTTRDIAPTIGKIYQLVGPDGTAFPGNSPWSKPLNAIRHLGTH